MKLFSLLTMTTALLSVSNARQWSPVGAFPGHLELFTTPPHDETHPTTTTAFLDKASSANLQERVLLHEMKLASRVKDELQQEGKYLPPAGSVKLQQRVLLHEMKLASRVKDELHQDDKNDEAPTTVSAKFPGFRFILRKSGHETKD